MAFTLFQRRSSESTIQALYGVIVAQARQPIFYAGYGVPDTLEGRFDMIVLHLALLLRRLRSEPDDVRVLGQAVFDAFCRDMDHNLRELGLSDMAVPRRMRRFGEAFYGRAAAYDAALDGAEADGLALALSRNILMSEGSAEAAPARLAVYVREAELVLRTQPGSALAQGALHFPTPQFDAPTSTG